MKNAAEGHTLHIMGLVSDGGVHSHMKHLMATINMAKKNGVKDVAVHCFLDGRDVPPKSAMTWLGPLEEYLKENERAHSQRGTYCIKRSGVHGQLLRKG